ncbi:MAG: ATP-binding protein [Proteobacteria bacterium]|nr:ATP-binding protein [Pseudomonadota bacterium]
MNAATDRKWGFYGRSREQADIEGIISSGRWFFCAISGRRRIGKTTLIQRSLRNRPDLKAFYFQVPDSDERGVVQTFQDALEDYGFQQDEAREIAPTFRHMAATIKAMCELGWIIVIDEFQYFHRKALAPFTSFLQAEVDKLRDTDKGGLFVLGSIHTEMTAILEDRASPLFNRVTHRIQVGHWDFETLFEMFDTHGVTNPMQRLFLWSLFEGVPKFYRDCNDQYVLEPLPACRPETLRKLFFEGPSPLRDEATNWFLRELRGRYDSVLKLLARKGPCSHGELTAEYARAGSGGEKQLSAYLHTLIDQYGMVERRLPVFAPEKARKARYEITDNFLAAWLHALERNVQSARIQPVERAVARADTGLQTHEGFTFEKMIRQLTEECSRKGVEDFHLTELVKGYWNKPDGSDIELDLVAINEDAGKIRIGSCKRSASAHDVSSLKNFDGHIDRFLETREGRRYANWEIQKAVYSPVFSPDHQRALTDAGYVCRDMNDFATLLGRPPGTLLNATEEET